MKKGLFTIFIITILLITGELYSQIKGKIIDVTNSEPLIGATVKVTGTRSGAVADIDGSYIIEGLQPGIYELKVSYIGYDDKIIANVEVKAGLITKLDVALAVDGLKTDEIVVEATTTLANEQALLVEQKNSDKVQDGISEQQIKRAPDAAASEVLKRVTGVNIINDKFVFVRGTSERYSLTTLNGMQVPSTESDKKSFSFDLFPSNLLENIIISKTFTPDQPGNLSGGLVQVNTKDFPDYFTASINTGISVTDNTTNKDFRTYNAGQKNFLLFTTGKDDGGRQMPLIFPDERLINTNFSNEQLADFSKAFRNNWGQTTRKAPMNTNLQISTGNNFIIGSNPLGVYLAYSYRTSFENEGVYRSQYNNDLSTIESFKGDNSSFRVLNGGILNFNYKIGENNKFGFKNTYTINSEDVTTYLEGSKLLTSEDNKDFHLYQTKFSEREMLSSIVSGEHFFENFARLGIKWNAGYSTATRYEPDIKTMTYERLTGTDDPYTARMGSIADNDGGGRLFMDLKDVMRTGSLDFSLPFIKIMKQRSKIKFGVYASNTTRDFRARNFAPKLNGFYTYIPTLPLAEIFGENNIGTNKIYYEELTRESDNYRANDENYSGYAMFDVPAKKLRIIAGVRFEYNRQQVNTLGRINEPIKADLLNRDFLPSVNLVYSLTELSNIRASVSQTISRPELREIAPFGYIDYVTGVKISGNPNIQRSLIHNYDLRYELYPNPGEIFSASLFYKSFTSPIEEIYAPGQNNPEKTFDNARNGAVNYGIEFEFRKKLGFISEFFRDFSLNTNLTFLNSSIDLKNLATISTDKTRKMQGQSPYTINFGLFYDNIDIGLSANILYNRFGKRISEVGYNGFSDIYEDGNDLVDFSVSKNFFKNFEVKFSVKDLLNQEKKYFQDYSGTEKLVRMYDGGRRLSLTLGYKL